MQTSKNTTVIISMADLRTLIKMNRLDELKRFKGLVKSQSIERRIKKLKTEIDIAKHSIEGISKANSRKSIRLTVREDVPEIIKQYIVR